MGQSWFSERTYNQNHSPANFIINQLTTLEKIKAHAEELIRRGAPFTKRELAILKSATPLYTAGNAGKRRKTKTGK